MGTVAYGHAKPASLRKAMMAWGMLTLPLLGIGGFLCFASHSVSKPTISLFQAVDADDIQAVKDHLATGTPTDTLDPVGHTALYEAILQRRFAIASVLIDGGAPTDHEGSHLPTPLIVAAGQGRADLVRKLLERGAKTEVVPSSGETVLHAAARGNSPALVRVFLQKGADPNAKLTRTKATPLSIAAASGNLESVELLLAAGSKVDAPGNLGRTPLHIAAANGSLPVVERLLEAGADPNKVDQLRILPVSSALVNRRDPKIVDLLIDRMSGKVRSDFRRGNPLHYAVMGHANGKIIDQLIDKGCRINQMDGMGNTPLLLALETQNKDAENLLRARGSVTPLWYVIYKSIGRGDPILGARLQLIQ